MGFFEGAGKFLSAVADWAEKQDQANKSKKKGKKAGGKKPARSRKAVIVAYWDLDRPITQEQLRNTHSPYTFRWPLPQEPVPGMRVQVEGPGTGVVLRKATAADLRRSREAGWTYSELSSVLRILRHR